MHLTLPDINPVIFQFGFVSIRWYALAYVAGIVLGWLYIGKLLRNEPLWTPRPAPQSSAPLSTDQLDDLILWITGGVILGGRIGYILFYDASIIWTKPLEVFMIQHGGMSFHGGFLGVVISTVLYTKLKKFDLAQILNIGDLLACAAPIGLGLGRLANFVNGELWGRTTDVPWAMVFCNRYNCAGGLSPRHPSQLYEAACEGLILFAVLWYLSHVRREFKRPGLVMGAFIVGYGIFRVIIENFREPDEQMIGFFKNVITMGQSLSLLMLIAGSFFIWFAVRNDKLDAGQSRVA